MAEIRPGTIQDAIRYGLRANLLHGKRMTDADYRRAIKVAFDHDLVGALHAKDVVPALVALTNVQPMMFWIP